MNNNIHNHRAPKHKQKFIGMQNNSNNHNNNYVIILLFWNVWGGKGFMFHTFSHKISFKYVISELPPLVDLEP
jgi:hypothetical protein